MSNPQVFTTDFLARLEKAAQHVEETVTTLSKAGDTYSDAIKPLNIPVLNKNAEKVNALTKEDFKAVFGSLAETIQNTVKVQREVLRRAGHDC